MTCIIIDDEAAARAVLWKMCNDVEDVDVIEEFESPIEALKFLNKDQVDLIFLDIHMPGFSGFDFLETLREPPKVVLTTSDDQFALASYEYVPVVDYLVKPITLPRFEKALEKVRSQRSRSTVANPEVAKSDGSNGELFVNIDRRLIKILFKDIQLIQAEGDYIVVKTEKEDIRVHTTLKSILEKLPEDPFLQIHRSFVINTRRIIDIEDNSVLIGKNVIPISRSNRPKLMKRLNLL